MKPFWKTSKFQIRWNEPLGDNTCPYAYRYVFIFFNYSIRLHKWLRSDDKRYCHNHPWWFCTLVLNGAYTDVDINGKEDKLNFLSFRYRPSSHSHYVKVPKEGCITILITGKPINTKWGFFVNGKFKRPLKYFHKYGHPPCSEQ